MEPRATNSTPKKVRLDNGERKEAGKENDNEDNSLENQEETQYVL